MASPPLPVEAAPPPPAAVRGGDEGLPCDGAGRAASLGEALWAMAGTPSQALAVAYRLVLLPFLCGCMTTLGAYAFFACRARLRIK